MITSEVQMAAAGVRHRCELLWLGWGRQKIAVFVRFGSALKPAVFGFSLKTVTALASTACNVIYLAVSALPIAVATRWWKKVWWYVYCFNTTACDG